MAGIFGSTRILKENSENWRDGRYRLTQQEATPDQVVAQVRVDDAIINLRTVRRITLEVEHEDLVAKVQPRLAEYRQALASLPEMPAVQIEAEDYNGQNNVRRVEIGRAHV